MVIDDDPTWRTSPWRGAAYLLCLVLFVVVCGIAGADDQRHEIAAAAMGMR